MKRTLLVLATLGPALGCGRERPAAVPSEPTASAPRAPGAPPAQPAEELKEPKTWNLLQAASSGNVNDVKAHLRRDPGSVSRPAPGGMFPIQLAADNGRVEVIRVLLGAGADVNTPHPEVRATPLQYAAEGGHLAAVQALLDAGAAVDPADSLGRTPLMWAASKGRAAVTRELLGRGADPNRRTTAGWTALRFAEDKGHAEVAALLRERTSGRP